jgi:DNA-binding transcriptional LysR family regulator
MNLEQLRYFLEIARCEHLGRAAARLRLSPSTLSYSVECLERDLGVILFERRGKNIQLTEQGRSLFEAGPSIFAKINDVKEMLGAAASEGRNKYYTLAATHGLVDYVLAPGLRDLIDAQRHRIEVLSRRSAEIIQDVLAKKVDLGLCFSPQPHPELSSRVVHEGRLGVFVSCRHPLAQRKRGFDVGLLNDFAAVLPLNSAGVDMCETHPMFAKFNITPRAYVGYDSYHVANGLIMHSETWTLLPEWWAKKFGEDLVALPLPKGWHAPFTIQAIWNRGLDLDRALKALLETFETRC